MRLFFLLSLCFFLSLASPSFSLSSALCPKPPAPPAVQGFRDDKSRGAALEECIAGVVDRCVLGAAGGCAVSAARECERTVARPTSRNPLAFATGAFRSKEDKAREVGAANENYREAREACEAARRERCNAEAREVCEGHASGFCAAVLRGRGKLRLKLGAESELMEESDEEEQEEEEEEEEEGEEDEEAKEQDRVSEKGKR